jgi:chemotaxis signal transduction protein
MFLDRDLHVMSTTADSIDAAEPALGWVKEAARQGEARVVQIGEAYHAVGTKPDTGYREYPGLGGRAVVFIPIGKVLERRKISRGAVPQRAAARHESGKQEVLEFATFATGNSWYALPTTHVIEAVDARTLQTLPTGESWCAGFLMYAGEPIAVADLTRVLGEAHLETPRIVVVIRAQGRTRPLGLLVELLGDIPEVAADRLLPIDGSREQLATLAIEPADPTDPLVMILSPERLAALLYGTTQHAPEAVPALQKKVG